MLSQVANPVPRPTDSRPEARSGSPSGIGQLESIYSEKNYNTGGDASAESIKDAKPVTVTLYHDRAHPSVLYVPLGQPEAADKP